MRKKVKTGNGQVIKDIFTNGQVPAKVPIQVHHLMPARQDANESNDPDQIVEVRKKVTEQWAFSFFHLIPFSHWPSLANLKQSCWC